MHGNRAAISHSDGHTGGGKGFEPSGPNEENYAHETAPFDRFGIPFGNKGPMRLLEGPTVRIRLPPAESHVRTDFRGRRPLRVVATVLRSPAQYHGLKYHQARFAGGQRRVGFTARLRRLREPAVVLAGRHLPWCRAGDGGLRHALDVRDRVVRGSARQVSRSAGHHCHRPIINRFNSGVHASQSPRCPKGCSRRMIIGGGRYFSKRAGRRPGVSFAHRRCSGKNPA